MAGVKLSKAIRHPRVKSWAFRGDARKAARHKAGKLKVFLSVLFLAGIDNQTARAETRGRARRAGLTGETLRTATTPVCLDVGHPRLTV